MSKLKSRLSSKAARLMEFPENALGSVSDVSLVGNGSVMINGCRSVTSYEKTRIVLRLCDRSIEITGDGLLLKTYYKKSISVSGRIDAIRLFDK